MRAVRMANPTHRVDERRLHGPTGEPAVDWRTALQRPVNTVAAWDGSVYVTTNLTMSDSGLVVALDDDGVERWRFEAGGAVQSSPAVVDGTVYVGSDDDCIYALDAATGTQRWARDTGWDHASPAVVDGTVFTRSDRVLALDAADGTTRWSFRPDWGSVLSSPAVVDGTVYVGVGRRVCALDAADGTLEWTVETGDLVQQSPTVVGGRVYVGSQDGQVHAVEAADGSRVWRHGVGATVQSTAAVVDGTVYVVGDGTLHALYAATGKPRWYHATGDAAMAAPAVADGTVYAGGNCLCALAADDGTVRWRRTDVEGVTAVWVADGTVHAATTDRRVVALSGDAGGTATDLAGSDDGARGSDPAGPSYCPSCGDAIERYDDPAFCPECGAEL